MTQVSWRAQPDLVVRVKQAAHDSGRSMNEYITWALECATNPEYGGSEAERLRERLRAAGILAELPPYEGPVPTDEEVERARRAFSGGTSLSDVIVEGRG